MAGNSSWPPASASPPMTVSSTPSVSPKTALQRLVKSNKSGSSLPPPNANTAGTYHPKKKRPEPNNSLKRERGFIFHLQQHQYALAIAPLWALAVARELPEPVLGAS